MKKIIIAIDGFSSSGKSTMAKTLARKVGYSYIDTGAMYRAVTLFVIQNNLLTPDGSVDVDALTSRLDDIHISFRVEPSSGKSVTILNGEDVENRIRTLEVSNLVSPVAEISAVRRHLVALQQAMGKEKGVVMDGRDIGTVVFPDAELKVFVAASPEVRAMRRTKEMEQKGIPVSYEEVFENLQRRDYIDSHRADSPLRQADDALLLDNDNLTPEEQMQWLLQKFQERVAEND